MDKILMMDKELNVRRHIREAIQELENEGILVDGKLIEGVRTSL